MSFTAADRFWGTMHSVATRDPAEWFPWDRRAKWSEVSMGMHPGVIDSAIRKGLADSTDYGNSRVRLTAEGRKFAAAYVAARAEEDC